MNKSLTWTLLIGFVVNSILLCLVAYDVYVIDRRLGLTVKFQQEMSEELSNVMNIVADHLEGK